MQETITIQGFEELEKALRALPEAVEKKILADSLRAGAKPIHAAAVEKCPVYHGPSRPDVTPGQLKKSIKIKTSRRKGRVRVMVQTGEGDFKGDEFYGAFVEFGHKIGARPSGRGKHSDSRSAVEPHPFLRPAFDEKKDAAATIIADKIREGIYRNFQP